jgi:hypothetical protein
MEGERLEKPMHTKHSPVEHQEALLRFPLDGLLPAHQILVVNPRARTAIVFVAPPSGEAKVVAEEQFSPNGMRVLVPLLQAYPQYCSYEALLMNLYPESPDFILQQLREARTDTLRVVRRAIGSLTLGLQTFGLQVISLHQTGYQLKALRQAS